MPTTSTRAPRHTSKSGSNAACWRATANPRLYAYFQQFREPDSGQALCASGLHRIGSRRGLFRRRGAPARADSVRAQERPPGAAPSQPALISARFSCSIRPERAVDEVPRACSSARPACEVEDEYGAVQPSLEDLGRCSHRPHSATHGPKRLLIADGHHRYETALAFRNENPRWPAPQR